MGREKMDDRVGQIRKVAIRLFNKYGFKGTSVEMIEESGRLEEEQSLPSHQEQK